MDYKKIIMNTEYSNNMIINKISSMFKFKNLPETIPERFIISTLIKNPFVLITQINSDLFISEKQKYYKSGLYLIPVKTTLTKNIYNDYNDFMFVHPDLTKTLYLNDFNSVHIHFLNEHISLIELIEKYNFLINSSELTLFINLINLRIPFLFGANSTKQKNDIDVFMKKIIDGDLSIVFSEDFKSNIQGNTTTIKDITTQRDLTKIIETLEYLKGQLWHELGLPANFNMKRESLNKNEVNINEHILRPLIDTILNNLKSSFENVNLKFGTQIEIELDSSWAELEDEKNDKISSIKRDSTR